MVEARDHRKPNPRIAHVLIQVRVIDILISLAYCSRVLVFLLNLYILIVLIQVQVIDINDNAPVFLGLPYFAVVPIDARKGEEYG